MPLETPLEREADAEVKQVREKRAKREAANGDARGGCGEADEKCVVEAEHVSQLRHETRARGAPDGQSRFRGSSAGALFSERDGDSSSLSDRPSRDLLWLATRDSQQDARRHRPCRWCLEPRRVRDFRLAQSRLMHRPPTHRPGPTIQHEVTASGELLLLHLSHVVRVRRTYLNVRTNGHACSLCA